MLEILHLGDRREFEKGVEHLKNKDQTLRRIIEKHGVIKFTPEGEMFQSLAESIIGQQLAGAAASAITDRVKALYNQRAIEASSLHKTPARKLRSAGVSPQKVRYLKDLSSRVIRGQLDLEILRTKPDGEVMEALDPILGIGPWTVQMLLIFTLGRTDVLPVDDLGIKKSIKQVYSLKRMPKKEKIQILAKNWHPYCSIASLYLWKHKDSSE